MSALTLFLDLKIYSIIYFLVLFAHRNEAEWANWYDLQCMKLLVATGTDIVKSTYELIDSIEYIRQNHLNTPSFEIGYLMFTTFEVYRKMVDKHNTSHVMNRQLFTMELLLYLEEIENHYWELDHLTSMLHEIERKYNVSSSIYSKHHEVTSVEIHAINAEAKERENPYRGARETLKRSKVKKNVLDRLKPTTKKVRSTRFPLEYGWDYPDPEDVKKNK